MKATKAWLDTATSRYVDRPKSSAFVHLTKYTAELLDVGSGDPVVLIPGLAGGFELAGRLANALAPDHRVVSYQLRGENDCFVLRHPFDMDDLVDDFAELIDQLNLERPTVMGVSFGGVIALKFAIKYPNRLGRLVVQGVGARQQSGLMQQIAATVLARFPLPSDSPFVNQFFNLLFGGKQKRDGLFEFVTRQIWQTDQSVMAHRFRLLEGLDLESELHRIIAPTLVLAGERDVLVSPRSLQPFCNEIAKVQIVRMPGCGHLAFVTKPDLVRAEVNRFLDT